MIKQAVDERETDGLKETIPPFARDGSSFIPHELRIVCHDLTGAFYLPWKCNIEHRVIGERFLLDSKISRRTSCMRNVARCRCNGALAR